MSFRDPSGFECEGENPPPNCQQLPPVDVPEWPDYNPSADPLYDNPHDTTATPGSNGSPGGTDDHDPECKDGDAQSLADVGNAMLKGYEKAAESAALVSEKAAQQPFNAHQAESLGPVNN
jgi:hypothetical protein